MLLWFFMAVAATSLLPAVYFIKNSTRLFNSGYAGLNIGLDLLVFLGVPVLKHFVVVLDEASSEGLDV